MTLWECFKSALSAIRANKLRSLLTMLGIIIGISAVITITMLGSTLSASVNNAVSDLGGNSVEVYLESGDWVTDPDTGDRYYDEDPHFQDKLISLEMLEELDAQYPGIYKNATYSSIERVTMRNAEGKEVITRMTGAFEGYLKYESYKMVAGRNLTLRDNLEYRNTMLVSDRFVKKYFINGEEPIGQTISVNSAITGCAYEYTIVGVYKMSSFMEQLLERQLDDPDAFPTEMIVPLMSASRTIANEEFTGTDCVTFIADQSMAGDVATENLKAFFEEKYADSPKISVEIWSNAEDMAITNKAIGLITIVISIIAGISLIVGGVGVMNIMLVSVTERTREIGVRKALGAKRRNIRMQFIIEAVVICLIGGIIGILLGVLNGELICIAAKKLIEHNEEYRTILSSVTVQPSATAIVVSVVFSTLTGVFFGWYPANKASKMNPIDALRYD